MEDCLIHDISVVEKQATGVQFSMSKGITVRHCTIYNTGRAGLNINEGTFGGHVIEFCDVFDTVQETGDHGSFNSWGRDRYWNLQGAPDGKLPELAMLDVEKNIIRNSRWRCDRGWDVDLDDGSSNYEIYNNLFLHGGLKLREGFNRYVHNNIAVNNSLHPHVWFANSGDVVENNIWMGAYRPAGGMPKGKWGKDVDRNLFTAEGDMKRFAGNGCDADSVVGDPMFVDPSHGDYSVKADSPALKLGFKNFPMDQFGVIKPSLRKIARRPELPVCKINVAAQAESAPLANASWLGAKVHGLEGEEYSAFGVSKEDGGVQLIDVPAGSALALAGLQAGDLIQGVNGKKVVKVQDLNAALMGAGGNPVPLKYVRQQTTKQATLTLK